MEIEDLSTNLKVISMIKENGRLCIRNGCLSIEPEIHNKENVFLTWGSYASLSLRRWWNQDNRHSAMIKVQSIILKCQEVYSKLSPEEKIELSKLCKDAAIGLSNLQQTYTHDAAVFARLSVYIKNLNGVV
jgi:hypothetical protein